MLKFDNKHLVFDNKQLVYNNTELKRKIYVFDSEIGVLTDKTILKSYQTQKFKKWRRDNLQNRIVYECIDDDSDLHLGNYIKMLEDIN